MKLIKNAKNKYFCCLACHGNKWTCSKLEKTGKTVFYFLVKVPSLNLY